MTRAAIYARQSIDEEQGIAQQLADCQVKAAQLSWSVVAEFVDNDTSGTKERGAATQWAAMLKSYDAGEFDALIVVDVDRLTRRLSDIIALRSDREVRIVTVRSGIDTQHDDLSLKIFVLMAEQEVKTKNARMRRYATERHGQGHPSPGHTPYGYRWVSASERDASGARFAIVEEEADVVRQAFADFLAGSPLGQIARDLNAAGHSTRAGKKWIRSTIRRMLMNTHYAALLPPSQPLTDGHYDLKRIDLDTCIPGSWEPIVEPVQVRAARAQLVEREPNHQGTARKWLLSGIAVCAICEEPVYAARAKTWPRARLDGSGRAPQKTYHSYRCRNYHFQRAGEPIEAHIVELVVTHLSHPDAPALLAPAAKGEESLRELQAKLIDLGEQEAVAIELASTRKRPDAAKRTLDRIDEERAGVQAKIDQAAKRDPLADVIGAADVWLWWRDASLGRKRVVIETLMDIAIKPVKQGQRMTSPDSVAPTLEIEWKRSAK